MGQIFTLSLTESIRLRVRLPTARKSLNLYVNDAIGYRMAPEQTLYYSDNVYGSADTISFAKGLLRIHDLKTGLLEASFAQLMVYAALFCLEYRTKPFEIKTELRIYQNDEVKGCFAEPDDLVHIMDRIVTYSRRIDAMRLEERQ